MKKRIRLAYCMNVFPGEDVAAVVAQLAKASAVRERLGLERMGVGLWLCAAVARELARDAGAVVLLRRELERRGLFAFTVNAFPFGGFHESRVKHAVFRPAWHEEERLVYTLDAARALAALLPEGETAGTLSSVPIGWRSEYEGPLGPGRLAAAGGRLARAVRGLAEIEAETGRQLWLLLEPEPGSRLETTEDVLAAHAVARGFCEGREVLDLFERHLGLCFDCCHQAVVGEDLAASLRALRGAGVPVGKVHVSSALAGTIAALARFSEPRYLHQVVAEDGSARADDLEDVARDPAWAERRALVHFHVPVHEERFGAEVETTRPALEAALDEVLSWPCAPDLEVETYTWPVLPREDGAPLDIVAGIADEMRWVLERVARAGKEAS